MTVHNIPVSCVPKDPPAPPPGAALFSLAHTIPPLYFPVQCLYSLLLVLGCTAAGSGGCYRCRLLDLSGHFKANNVSHKLGYIWSFCYADFARSLTARGLSVASDEECLKFRRFQIRTRNKFKCLFFRWTKVLKQHFHVVRYASQFISPFPTCHPSASSFSPGQQSKPDSAAAVTVDLLLLLNSSDQILIKLKQIRNVTGGLIRVSLLLALALTVQPLISI